MFSQGNQEYQFQQTAQQTAFETAKVGLDSSNQSMLSLLNEDEFSQQQQQQQQQQPPVNCQPLSYYSNQITNNSYGSLPSQVQRNYMQYAQQSHGMAPSPYTATNANYQMQQTYQRSNSYPNAYASQHAGAYYPNTPMASPYQGYATTQGYPTQGRSPANSPNMLPTVTAVGPKYPQIPPNSASPVMAQGSTMYSPGSVPVNNRTQFQFPTSPVPHPARPSPIQSPSAPKRSPAAMTCPSPIQSHSPAPVGSTNSASPMPVRSPQNNSPSFTQNRVKQKQEMVDLSSMSKMYQPPSRSNPENSDKKHTYSSPKRGGPIPKMEEMVAFIGEPIMREVLTSEKDGEKLTLKEETGDKLPNGKCDDAAENGGSENGNSKTGSKEENLKEAKNHNETIKNSVNDEIDGIHQNGENSTPDATAEVKTPLNENSQFEEPLIQPEEKNVEPEESQKPNNRKRKTPPAQAGEPLSNQKAKEKTKRTKAKGPRANSTENSPNETKSKVTKSRSKNKTSGKTKEAPKKESNSIENGFEFVESDDLRVSDDDGLDGKRLSINRPIKTYSKKHNSKEREETDLKDSNFDEIMKTAQTKEIANEAEKAKALDTVKNGIEVKEKNEKSVEKLECADIAEIQCKNVEVLITKVDTFIDKIVEKKDHVVDECPKTSEETTEKKQEVKNPMLTPSLKRQLTEDDGHDTCESDHAAPSSRKRGRPFGSKNKTKRLTKKEKALLESECLGKDVLDAAKKSGVKQPPLNPKLAISLFQSTSQIVKPVGPVLRINGTPDKPVSSRIVNQPNANTDAAISKKSKSIDLSKRIHRPTSSAAIGSTYCEMGRPWLCALCGKLANVNGLGDLYGPYYPEGFKPPKRCTQEEKNKTPTNSLRHTPKSKTSKVSLKLSSNSKSNSQRRRSSNDIETEPIPDQTPTTTKNNSKAKGSSSSKLKSSKSVVKPLTKSASAAASRRTSSTDTDVLCTLEEVWVHEECAVWAQGVYLVGGLIYGLHETVKAACQTSCTHCKEMGATLGCFSKACSWTSHYVCSVNADCLLREENYSMLCPKHKNKMVKMKDDT